MINCTKKAQLFNTHFVYECFLVDIGLAPAYLSRFLPEMRKYDLGTTNSIAVPTRHTDTFTNIFSHCINEWNNLSLELPEVRSFSRFKTKFISLVRPTKGRFVRIHRPSGVCKLTQLRVCIRSAQIKNFSYSIIRF